MFSLVFILLAAWLVLQAYNPVVDKNRVMMADKQQILSLKRVYGAARGSLVIKGSLPLDFLLGSDSAQCQDELVSELLLAPHFRDFPPSQEFRRLFWKYIVEYLEKAGEVGFISSTISGFYTDFIFVPTLMIRRLMRGFMKHTWISFPQSPPT